MSNIRQMWAAERELRAQFPKKDPITGRMLGLYCWDGLHETDDPDDTVCCNPGETLSGECHCLCHEGREVK